MNENDHKKQSAEQFNSLWEQVIQWKKDVIKSYEKEKNVEMVKFHKETLEKLQNEYKRVKIKT
jgi:hypothetical protein